MTLAIAYLPMDGLSSQMIIVAKPSNPFTYTAKNTARRQAVINDYEMEIDALYDAVEKSAKTGLPHPAHWDFDSSGTFVREVVMAVMTRPVSDEDDLFQHGCDRFVFREYCVYK